MLYEHYDVHNCEISICANSMEALYLLAKYAARIFIVPYRWVFACAS